MSKNDEIEYIQTVARTESVPVDTFSDYLARKPFSDAKCWEYLADFAQILAQLPVAPARLLDLGCGSGWTTEMFARCGYNAVGVDIAPDFIALANRKLAPGLDLHFKCHDYERSVPFGEFDCVVIFDALHHADDPSLVVHRAAEALRPGGTFVVLEPGAGHSTTADSIGVMEKYGTTEKDMPFSFFSPFLCQAGFTNVRQYLRVRQLPLVNLATAVGPYHQIQHATGLCFEVAQNGLTSLVVAQKGDGKDPSSPE